MLESDLYVHCANIEVEGMSCMEAFACGCVPLISDARLSSTKSFALHKCNLFKHGDALDLARKIDYFYEVSGLLYLQTTEYMRFAETMSVSLCAEKLINMMSRAIEENGK